MKKRKIIATALMAGLVFSSSSAYAADLTGFKDAPQAGSSAYESLNYAVEKGYLAGIDGELKADKTLTRAELAAIVVRAYGKDAVASNLSQFKDVKKDAWYYEELAKAYSKGYIKGKSATMMAPNETVSQLEALVIIARASGHTGGSQADLAKISEKVPAWAVSNIGSLVKAGVIKADSNGKLNLSAKMTRGNFAGAVYKADKSIDNRTQEDNAKNAKKGDTNNPLDKNGKNPYLPAPGSSSSGGGGGNPPSPSPQGKAERFKAEMGTVPTLRTSIETDKFELEIEEKSKITADRISKALDTEGKKQTYGYIDVSVKTNVDRSSVGKKEAVATLKFNDNSELEVKIPVEVEELPVAYIHPVIKLSSALTGKEFAVGDNLDLSDMKTIVPFVKQLKEDGTWDETSAQAVYVAYKDLGVANIKVVKKGTETEFVNNSPVTADMIEDGKIALEVYKEKIISKDTDAKNRQSIKGLKAKAGTPSPQTKAERFKAEMGTVPTLRTSIETDKFELEVEEKSKITADRISKALDTEGKKQTYGYIDVSVKTNVDRSSVGKKEAVATLKFNDNSELEVKIPVEVEELPVAYIHPVIKLSSALTGKEFAVGDNLDLSDMKTIVPFVKQLKEDGTWDETSAQAVYVAYKDLGVANIKVVKKGTETEFVNNSPVTADMIEDGKIALEVYKEKIISKDTDAKNRQPIKGLKAKAGTPSPQGKAERFKAEMGTVPTLRTSIETDKFELEVEEKSKITADRISKALDTEGKKQTYGYIDVSVKTNVDRSSVGKKEAVATLKFNDNSELEVKIPVEVEELPVAYIHPVIKLSSALTGKEFAVGDNLDLSDMKTIVPFVKQLKEDGTWDETSAQAVYVAYKDLGVANIKVVKKGTETEFVNNSPVTADMIEDGKIALEVYKEKIISKDTDAKNRQPIKGLKAKAGVPNPPAPGPGVNPLFGDIDGKNILSKAQVETMSQNLHFEDGEYFGDTVGFVESKPLPVKITVTNGKVVAVDVVREEIGKIWPGSYPNNAVDDGGKFEASCIRAFNLVASKGKDPIVLAYQMKAARDLTRQTLAVSSDTGKEISEALVDIVGKNKFGPNNTTVRSHYDNPSDAEDDVMRCMKVYLTSEYGYEQYAFDTISGATFSGAGGAVAIGNALKKATADVDIKDFRVKTFAIDKHYMVGDEADWSDVVVTVTKKDGSTVDVPYAQFSDYGLSVVIKADKGYHKYLPFPQGERFEKAGAVYPRVYHQASETYKFLKAMNVTTKRKVMKGEKIQVKVKGTENWIDLLDYQTDEYVQRLKVPTAEVGNINGKEVEFREVAKDVRSGEIKEFSLKLASTPDAPIIAKVDGSEQYEVVIPQSELKVDPPYSINPNNHRIILSAE